MNDAFWQKAVEKAEAGVDPARLRPVGRPRLGDEPSELTAVRLPPTLKASLAARARRDHVTASEVMRRALERYL